MNYTQKLNLLFVVTSTIMFPCANSRAHDQKLHARMSEQAAHSSDNLDMFARDNFVNDYTWVNTQFTYGSETHSIIDWIRQGSIDEDDGTRSGHHFYAPDRPNARPLTDPPTRGFNDSPPVTSFKWASDHEENLESWKKARGYEFDALTSQTPATRGASWGHMFKSVGHVIHLNQDLSQPGHTRDDNHVHKDIGPVRLYYRPAGPGSPIEDYGLKYLENALKSSDWTAAFPGSPLHWSDWQAAGLKKLEDFWDRKFYNGQAQALNESEDRFQPAKKLGLGEWSNGNFLSEDALYEEINRADPPPYRHLFPFPSLRTGTDFETVFRKPSTSARPQLLRNGNIINTAYIDKTGDGVKFENHAALRYFKVKRPEIYPYGIDINNDKVLQAYHEKVVPKAIEYSAGILDYFFRGRLQVSITPSATKCEYDLVIRNVSQQDLKGGEFRLYWDNDSGVRTRLLESGDDTSGKFSVSWNSGSTFADNGTITATLKPPANITGAEKCTLVYKGTIVTSGNTPDPVDDTLGIATTTFDMPCHLICLGQTRTFANDTLGYQTIPFTADSPGCIFIYRSWGDPTFPCGSGSSIEGTLTIRGNQ